MSLLNDASLVLIPSGYKEDKVYSIIPSDGSGDLDFVRGSDGTRINSLGQVENVCWNLAQQSEAFDNAYWNKYDVSTTANSTSAPNGTNTAELVYPTSSGNYRYVNRVFNENLNNYTFSVYAKAQSKSVIWLYIESSAGYGLIYYDLSDGTMQIVAGSSSTPTGTITSVGNGWYRCSFTLGEQLALSSGSGFGVVDAKGSPYVTASGTNGVYIWGAQMNLGSTAKPYFPTTDRLNVPRLTYENGCPSLLLEKQSTNMVTYSEEFDNAAWSKETAGVTANAIVSPDGTQNADAILDNIVNSRHIIYQFFNADLSINRTFTVFAKKNTLRYLFLCVTGSADVNCYSAIFDLQDGLVTDTKANGTGTVSASIQAISNGWYRCSISGTIGSGTAIFFPIIGTSDRATFTGSLFNNNAPAYVGSGQSLYIWGAQLEASSYPTSYIPTTSTSVTRLADSCYKTGISSLIGQTSGTMFVDFIYGNNEAVNRCFSLTDSNWVDGSMRFDIVNNQPGANLRIGGTSVADITSTTFPINTGDRLKVAIGYDASNFVLYINGVNIGSVSISIGSVGFNEIDINALGGGFYSLSQNNQRNLFGEALLFQRLLTNTELAQLTTI